MKRKTKLITQPTPETGCGIAVFAMIAGFKNYETAKAWLKAKNLVVGNDCIQTPQMKSAINQYFKIDVKNSISIDKDKRFTAVYLRDKNNKKCFHWVLRDDEYYFDPLPNKRFNPTKRMPSRGYDTSRYINFDL